MCAFFEFWMMDNLNNSQTSISSTIQLPSRYESNSISSALKVYNFSIKLDSYENISSLLENEDSFWFSWSILDITIQTAVFDVNYPEETDDSILIKCSDLGLMKFLREFPSIRVFLCVPNKILAYFEILIPSEVAFPVQSAAWYQLVSPDNHDSTATVTRVHATLDIRASVESQIASTMNQSIQVSQDLEHVDNSSQGKEDHEYAEFEDEIDPEYDRKKFRLSFQVRSIRALKRAAHISLQFAYPHLGVSSSPIRTHGCWCLAHSETLIEGASVSYEFPMIPSQLMAILQQNKLVINVISRTHLGTDRIGDATVDLNSLHTSKSVNLLYRCPLTGKQFKTLDQYKRHRQTMIALYTLGRINEVPSKYPVIIRSIDLFTPILGKLSPQSNGNPEVVGKLRCILILEQLGRVASTLSGQLHDPLAEEENVFREGEKTAEQVPPPPPPPTLEEEEVLRRLEWEEWRRKEEEKWMNSLREKELKLRQRLEEELTSNLAQKADDLRRAQEEVGRLEVRLRTSIETVEKQKLQLEMKEEQMNMRLAQKTEELNLLQKRIREDGKSKIEQEVRKNQTLEAQIKLLQESLQRTEKRALDAEKDYDSYRQYVRSVPETQLREELAKQKSIVSELRKEVEKEKRMKTEMELEKEHYRAQLQRVALALKREREKNSVMARQELEQLRLEFLAREERYVLDGDREELRSIREELSHLRAMNDGRKNVASVPKQSPAVTKSVNPSTESIPASTFLPSSLQHFATDQAQIDRLKQMKQELLQSRLYDPSDSVIQEIDEAIHQQQILLTKKIDGVVEQKS